MTMTLFRKIKRMGISALMILAYMLSFVQLYWTFNKTDNKNKNNNNNNRIIKEEELLWKKQQQQQPFHRMNNNMNMITNKNHPKQQQNSKEQQQRFNNRKMQQQLQQPKKNPLLTPYEGKGVQYHTCKYNNNETLIYPQYPTFIIAGAQKTGTTSLMSYFNKHPLIAKPTYNEPHFFDRTIQKLIKEQQKRRNNNNHHKKKLPYYSNNNQYQKKRTNINNNKDNNVDNNISNNFNNNETESWWCYIGKEYYNILTTEKKEEKENEQEYQKRIQQQQLQQQQILLPFSFEKTPSYLHRYSAPKMIQLTCPWIPKIIIILRNPVDRAYSHYQFGNDQKSRTTKTTTTTTTTMEDADLLNRTTFEDYIQSEIKLMRSWNMTTAILPPILQQQQQQQQQQGGSENNNGNNESILLPALDHPIDEEYWSLHPEAAFNQKLGDQFHALMIRKGIYAPQLRQWFNNYPNDSILVLDYHELHKNTTDVYYRILDFVGIPHDQPIHDFNKRLHLQYEPMAKTTRRYLQAFYKPYNDQLAEILGDEWKDIWTGE